MSGQSFWKGFAAGAIGGIIGGVINYFIPGAGNLIGRAASTLIYDITNEIFQTGTFDSKNLSLYLADTLMDVAFSMIYIDKINCISNPFLSAFTGGVVDASVDIIQTDLYFSPSSQQANEKIKKYKNQKYSYKKTLNYAY